MTLQTRPQGELTEGNWRPHEAEPAWWELWRDSEDFGENPRSSNKERS